MIEVGLYLWCSGSFETNELTLRGYEQLGMDSAWVIDHLLGFAHPELWPELPASELMEDPDAFLDPFCVASVVGRETDLMLGSAVIDITRRRAADIARATLTVHHATRRGFTLGVGAGLKLNLLPFGYEYAKRVSVFERNLAELRHLFDTGRMPEGVGRHGLPLESDAGKPRIWAAAHGPRMQRAAARYADGWITSGIGPDQYAADRERVFAAVEEAGRPTLTCAFSPFVNLGASRDEVAAALERYPVAKLVLLFAPAATWAKHGLEHPGGADAVGYTDALPHEHDAAVLREVAERIPFELYEELVVCGNAEEIAGRLRPYADAGCEHFIFADTTGMSLPADAAIALMPEYRRVRDLLRARA